MKKKCEFCTDFGTIEITYEMCGSWPDGEAYFKEEDLIAQMSGGTFNHPAWGTAYKFNPPVNGRNDIASLERSTMIKVGHARVSSC